MSCTLCARPLGTTAVRGNRTRLAFCDEHCGVAHNTHLIGSDRSELVRSEHLPAAATATHFRVPRAMAAVLDAHVRRRKTQPIGLRVSLDEFAAMSDAERAALDPVDREMLERSLRLRSVSHTVQQYERMSAEERAALPQWERGLLEEQLRQREKERAAAGGKRTLHEAAAEEEEARRAPAVRDRPPESVEIVVSTLAEERARRAELMRTGRFPPHEEAQLVAVYPESARTIAAWMLAKRLQDRFGLTVDQLKGAGAAAVNEVVMVQALYEIVDVAVALDIPFLPLQFMFSMSRPLNPFWAVEIYAVAVCSGIGSEFVLLSLLASQEFMHELRRVFRDPNFAYSQTMRLVQYNGALVSPILLEALLNAEWMRIVFATTTETPQAYIHNEIDTTSLTRGNKRRAHLRRGPLESTGGKFYVLYVSDGEYRRNIVIDDSLPTKEGLTKPEPAISNMPTIEFVRSKEAMIVCFVRNSGILLRRWNSRLYAAATSKEHAARRTSDDLLEHVFLPSGTLDELPMQSHELALLFFTEVMMQNLGPLYSTGHYDFLLRYLLLYPRLIDELPRKLFISYLEQFNAWRLQRRAFSGAYQRPSVHDVVNIRQNFYDFASALAIVFYKHAASEGLLLLDAILQRIETVGFIVAADIPSFGGARIFVAESIHDVILRSAALAYGADNVPMKPNYDYVLELYRRLPSAAVISLSRSRLRHFYGSAFNRELSVAHNANCRTLYNALTHNLNLGVITSSSPLPPPPPPDLNLAIELYTAVFIHDRAELVSLTKINNFSRTTRDRGGGGASLFEVYAAPPVLMHETAVVQIFTHNILPYNPTAKQLARLLSAVVVELPHIEHIRLWYDAVKFVVHRDEQSLKLISGFQELLLSRTSSGFYSAMQSILQPQ